MVDIEKLKKLLTKYHLTQTEFGSILNVTQPLISEWLSEKRQMKVDHLKPFLEKYNLTVDTVLQDKYLK